APLSPKGSTSRTRTSVGARRRPEQRVRMNRGQIVGPSPMRPSTSHRPPKQTAAPPPGDRTRKRRAHAPPNRPQRPRGVIGSVVLGAAAPKQTAAPPRGDRSGALRRYGG